MDTPSPQFLVNTMEGQTDGVKVHHRLDAAKQLIRYGFSEEDSNFWGLIPTPEELAAKRKDKEPTPERPTRQVTFLDILNFDIARQIRDETDDGHLMVEFLVKVMNGQQRPFIDNKQRIKPADRMAAAKELLNRGFGSFGIRPSFASVRKEGRLRHDPRGHLAAHPAAHRVRQRHNPLPTRCDGRTAARRRLHDEPPRGSG